MKKFITNLMKLMATVAIATILAIAMIGMVIGASIQESDKLHSMVAAEVIE